MNMAYEQKDNSGSLFKNDRKESDSHPDYKGSALIDGADYWLDSWINTAKDGMKYMSLKLKRKDVQSSNAPPTRGEAKKPYHDLDDDLDSAP
jgi:uncharacterized protein (DUF736 family)